MAAPGCLGVALLVVLVAGTAGAQPLDTAGMANCDTYGYAADLDPRGSNLRAAPRANAPIIGHLAPRTRIDKETWTGIEFKIVGSRDGWLLVTEPDPFDGIKFTVGNARDGRAWISAKLVRTQLGSAIFRTAPRRDAPLVVRMAGGDWGPYSVGVLAVHGCAGRYVEVTAQPPNGRPVRGWSFWPCSSQLTTCDRPNADDEERLRGER